MRRAEGACRSGVGIGVPASGRHAEGSGAVAVAFGGVDGEGPRRACFALGWRWGPAGRSPEEPRRGARKRAGHRFPRERRRWGSGGAKPRLHMTTQ
jgi:hypothetical protein